jgi:ribosomal protein S6
MLELNLFYTSILIYNRKSKRKYYCTACDKIHTAVKNNRWRDNNIDKVKKAYLAYGLKKRAEITKHYVSTNLNISVKDVSDELYQAAKTNLILKRKLKQLKNGQEKSHL